MAGKYTKSTKCSYDGCKDFGVQSFRTKSEMRAYKRPFWCARHRNPETILTATKKRIESVLISKETKVGIYWDGVFGLKSGHGWKAFAEDFPEGTKLKITVEIETP